MCDQANDPGLQVLRRLLGLDKPAADRDGGPGGWLPPTRQRLGRLRATREACWPTAGGAAASEEGHLQAVQAMLRVAGAAGTQRPGEGCCRTGSIACTCATCGRHEHMALSELESAAQQVVEEVT